MSFEPDHEKVTQALNYLAAADGGTINKMRALKLVYFADRYHLRRYGRPVTGDCYVAMRFGPVASLALDVANGARMVLNAGQADYARHYLRPVTDGRGRVLSFYSAAPVDLDVFSESDIEALDFARHAFTREDGFQLAELTHLFPEWASRERDIAQGGKAVPMDYLDFFRDPEPSDLEAAGFEDPFQDDPEALALVREVFLEERSAYQALRSA